MTAPKSALKTMSGELGISYQSRHSCNSLNPVTANHGAARMTPPIDCRTEKSSHAQCADGDDVDSVFATVCVLADAN